MKGLMVVVLAAVLGFMAWQKYKPVPPPPPPPPPPAILSEPAPVIDPEEQRKVLKSAEDPDPNVRWEAVVLLDKMKSPEAMPLMFHMLQKDLEPQLRIKIIELLSNRRGADVVQALVRSMKDMEPEVRLASLRALDKIGDYSVASAIMAGPVKDQEEAVRLQALKVLNSLQDKKQAEIEAARQAYEAEKAAAAAEAAKNR
ncbi:MAG: HEAT repeat domain-containing protein [Elusimicrobiota bacterium]|nr:HEAT repeat domain-containing protein [Elusimicrobiota bacterium]